MSSARQVDFLLAGLHDTAGNPLNGGVVTFLEVGLSSTTPKAAWTDKDKAYPIYSVTLSTNGQAQVYCDGWYKFIVKDINGTTVNTWDNLFFSPATDEPVTKTGDYDFVANDTGRTYIANKASAIEFTLLDPDDVDPGWYVTIKNIGAGTLTVTGTVDGSADPTLAQYESGTVFSDGTSWYWLATPGSGGGGGSGGTPAEVVAKTDSYAFQAADINGTYTFNKSSTVIGTLVSAAAVPSGSWLLIKNLGAGLLTLSGTINGRTNPVLYQYDEAYIFSNGTAWYGYLAAEMTSFLENVGFTATVSSNALTITLTDALGNAPSTTNPVKMAFLRNSTLTTGKPEIATARAATTLVLPATGTLGFIANEHGRMYAWEINNAGTIVLGLSRTADLYPEGSLISTTAIGTGSDSAAIMYSMASLTDKAVRCIGYIEITSAATPGNWSTGPDVIQIMGPGVKRTGDVVQTKYIMDGTVATGTMEVPYDDTIPQIADGDEYMSLAITPTSAINYLEVSCVASLTDNNDAGDLIAALFQDTGSAIAVMARDINELESLLGTVPLFARVIAGTVSSTTFSMRAGSSNSSTVTFNGAAASQLFGGAMGSYMMIKEIFA